MAQPIVTKSGVCLETKWRRIMHRSWVGYICTCARADVPSPFPYLVNGWTDCDEIWYVVTDTPARRFTKSMTEYSCTCTHAHVRTPLPYVRSG